MQQCNCWHHLSLSLACVLAVSCKLSSEVSCRHGLPGRLEKEVHLFSTSLVNCMFEERALSTCWRTTPFWLRSVDDTFTAVRHDEIDAFHHNPSGGNTDVQFTRDEIRKRKFHKHRTLCYTIFGVGWLPSFWTFLWLSGSFRARSRSETEKTSRLFWSSFSHFNLYHASFATRLLIASWRTCFISRLLQPQAGLSYS